MPEIKHQFTGGKMNKDLDERLIPKGEYRDAMNVQVSTSEGSDIGAVQNILGNSQLAGQSGISASAVCVGAVADEKNDKLYWFVRDSGSDPAFDGIFEYTSGGSLVPVLIDTNVGTPDAVLKFNISNIITGINIVDHMLFWTDNQNEPKVISIPRSIDGTADTTTHTEFINDETEETVPIKEEHITVIKKGPQGPPTVELKSERTNDEGMIYTGTMRIATKPPTVTSLGPGHYNGPTPLDGESFMQHVHPDWNSGNSSSMWFPRSIYNHHYDFSQLSVGDRFDTYIETDINGNSGFELDWAEGDTLLFQAFGGDNYDIPPDIPLRNYTVKARIRDKFQWVNNTKTLPVDYNDVAQGLSDSPQTFYLNWQQGGNDDRLRIRSRYGFNGRIGEIHIYPIINGVPNTSVELSPNPYFRLDDPNTGTPLKRWKNLTSGCTPHGPGTNAGVQYSINPDYTDPDQPGVSYPDVIIDHVKFPCFPGLYHFGIYPYGPYGIYDSRAIDQAAWHIKHSNTAIGTNSTTGDDYYGYGQAGGQGYDGVQITGGGPENHGGLITFSWVAPNTPHTNPGKYVHFSRERGGNYPQAGAHGYDNWRWYANDLDIIGTDGNTYKSYDIMNQHGYMEIDMTQMNGSNPETHFTEGGYYQLVYTVYDTGHGRLVSGPGGNVMTGDYATQNGVGANGICQLAGQGYTGPWQLANYYTDQAKQVVRNGDFSIPDGNGNMPVHWKFIGTDMPFDYDPVNKWIDIGNLFDANGDRIKFDLDEKLNTTIPLQIEDDQIYNIKFELSDIHGDSTGIQVALVGQPYSEAYWKTPIVNTEGVHEFTIATTLGTGIINTGLQGGDRVFFESGGPAGGEGFRGKVHNISVERANAPNANVSCEILSIHNPPTAPEDGEITFAVDLEKSKNKLFEFKFPRFGYRYKYGDNEYSPMSPFSQVGFLPGNFNYDPKDGYNTGMTNTLIEATIKHFMQSIPHGVVAIDILYKDDTSPNVYIVDTIRPKNTALSDTSVTIWDQDEYTVTTEQIHRAVESNQLLRPWDAVPLKALAQGVTGNRVVYANYVQGFDINYQDEDGNIEYYYPDFNFDVLSYENLDFLSQKSVKSLREYQLGIVFADKYGRETPVMSNYTGTQAIEKESSDLINQLQVGFKNSKFPQNMKYFKFFIKETSNEYYNLAMDRWYDAKDGGAWLAFPSNDRNKVDIDTFLILKKPEDSDVAVLDETRYKILDIQDNVPDFVRQNRSILSINLHNFVDSDDPGIFGNSLVDAPSANESSFKMNYKPYFNTSGSDLHKIKDAELHIDFQNVAGEVTDRYRITRITCDYDDGIDGANVDDAQYSVVLDGSFGDDIGVITDDPLSGLTPTQIKDGTIVNIYQYTDEDLARFDGRFFAKIRIDADFNQALLAPQEDLVYRRVESKKLYYLSNDNSLHDGALTGQNAFNDVSSTYDQGFGKFAPFFRNYNKPANHVAVPLLDGSGNRNVGAFAFGDDSDSNRPWLKELAWITNRPDHLVSCPIGIEREDVISAGPNAGSAGAGDFWPGVKMADKHGYSNKEKVIGEFNVRGEQEKGDVWFIDGGNYFTEVAESKKLQWINDDISGGLNNTRIINSNTGSATGIIDGLSSNNIEYSTFEISVGTVYNDTVQFASYTSGSDPLAISDFWNIGREEHNQTNEDTYAGLKNVVNGIQPGKKFRFREDPTGEIYTIQQDVQEINRVRWGTISAKVPYCPGGGNNCSQYTNDLFDYGWFWDSPRDLGFNGTLKWRVNRYPGASAANHPNPATVPTGDYFKDTSPSTCTNYAYSTHNQFAKQLSPNFTKTWKPQVVNSEGQGVVNWNPATGVLGPIDNGLELEIFHSNEPAVIGTTTPTVKVIVDSLVGTNVDGTEHNITIGMILTSHSDGATDCVFDGSAGLEELAIYKITKVEITNAISAFELHLTGYRKILSNVLDPNGIDVAAHKIFSAPSTTGPVINEKMIFKQPTMNGYSQYSVNRINAQDPTGLGWDINTPGIMAIGYNLDFVEQIDLDANLDPVISENPAIWETEPKEPVDLDLYYEASGYYPFQLDDYDSALLIAPVGSKVESVNSIYMETGTIVGSVSVVAGADYNDLSITLSSPQDFITYADPDTGLQQTGTLVNWDPDNPNDYISVGDRLRITKPNGEIIVLTIKSFGAIDANNRTQEFIVDGQLYGINTNYVLNWHNCYSFGNGVESNRIRDNFNLPFISNGPRVSTTWEGDYNQEHRKYGLIYSGLYNTNSGVNNLNQFIAAEKITKDINPIYGSIQKLHSRDSDLVTLCEDKCLRILANKDAVFNADGNANLTATNNVLGQTIPFSGEFGISKNPESFASESYRIYFTDKVRGAVMRLSKDGLTPISMYGMKDWFRDNLKLSTKLIGSYDDKKGEYNITLRDINKTVSYKEDVRGWVSFKSFIPEFGVSMANNYYTMKFGKLFEHHKEIGVNRNTFYGGFISSSLNVILNDGPDSIKSFHTLNYEGSQSKIDQVIANTSLTFEYQNNGFATNYNDQEYYNLIPKDGWYADSIITDQDEGYTTNFIEKEGKWFTKMNKRIDINQ